jgi:hypothetical protein
VCFRGIPPEIVWLAVLIFAVWLSDTRTVDGRFRPEEGLLWGWSVSAFGIVATLSPLAGAERTRRRNARFFIEAFFGALLVDMILGAHVIEMNAAEVGEIEGFLNFFSHALVIGAMAFVIGLADAPKRQHVLRPLYVFAAGVVAASAFGMFLSWNSFSTLGNDVAGGLKGTARADFFGKMAGSMDKNRKPIRGGVLYKVWDWYNIHYIIVSRGNDFAYEVPLPFPDDAAGRDVIIALASSPEIQRVFRLPRRGCEIVWADRNLEPYTQPTLLFRLHKPVEQMTALDIEQMQQRASITSVSASHFRAAAETLLQMAP